MWFSSWLQQLAQRWSLHGRNRRRRAGRVPAPMRRRVRPRLEVLEDRVTPSGYDTLAFSTAGSQYATSITPNQPSGAISVQLQDTSGHAISTTSNVTVQLSSSSSTGEFLDLTGKQLVNKSIVIPTGTSYAFFEYEDSQQTGQTTLKGLSTNPFAFGGMSVNVSDRLVFTTPPQTLLPGQVTQPITIQLQDASSNAVNTTSDVTVSLNTSSSGGKLLDTSGNPLADNSITIAAGSSSASFEYEDSQVGNAFLSASTSTGVNASQTETFSYPLAFTTPVQSVASNQKTGPITVQLQDDNSNAVNAASDVTLNLSSSFFTGKFFDTSGNPLPTNPFGQTTLTVAAGSSSASFEYEDSSSGETTITVVEAASLGGSGLNGSVQQPVFVGIPLGITTPPQTIAPGKPSQPITVQLDGAATSDETISLSSDSSTGQFLDTSGNPLSTNSITIAAGSSSASFKYEDSQTGLPTITASKSDSSAFASQQENVGVSLSFITTPQTVVQGKPSGTITVQLQDSSGNPFNATSDTSVQLTSSSGGNFFDTSGNQIFGSITIKAGSSSASFEYGNSSSSGTQTVTATVNESNGTEALISGSQQETVTPPPFNSVVFVSPIQTLAPNQPSQPITVQLQKNGAAFTATSDMTIELSSSSSGGKLLDTSGNPLANNNITIAAGSSSASFEYEDSQEWFPTLTATVSGSLLSGTQTENVGGVSLAFSTSAQTIAAGQPSGTITVQFQDSNGNAVTNQSGFTTFVYLNSRSQTGQFLDTTGKPLASNSITIDAGASSASFEYEDSVGGNPTLSASTYISTALNASQQETVTGPYKVEFGLYGGQSSGQSIALNQRSQPITVSLVDSTFAPATATSDVTVSLSSTSSGGQFLDTSGNPLANSSIVIAAGTGSASFEYEDSQAGLPTLTASENGFSTTLQEVVGLKLAFTTSPQTFAAGQTSQPLTVQLQDSSGNAVTASSNTALNLVSNLSGGGFGTLGVQFLDTSGNSLPTTSNGLPTLTIAKGSSSASFEINSQWGGTPNISAGYGPGLGGTGFTFLLSASQQETVQGLSALVFTTSQQTVTAGQTSGVVTVQLEDNNGNVANAPSGGLTINLSSGNSFFGLPSTKFFDANGNPLPTNSQNISTITMPAGSSTVSFNFESTQAGLLTLIAGVPSGFSVEQEETVQARPPSSVVFVTPAQSSTAGTPSGLITVQLVDQYGNVISAGSGGLTFNLSSSSSTGQFLSASDDLLTSSSITIPQGASSATFVYEDSQAGTPTLTVTASGISGTQQETVASSSVIHVTNTNDSGDGSLRAAIDAANANAGSTIIFDSGVTGKIDLQSGLPEIVFPTNIEGPGANVLTIERSSTATDEFGGLTIGFSTSPFTPPEPTVTISGLSVANFVGGGIINNGSLTLRQVEVRNTQSRAASSVVAEGGIVNSGDSLTVLGSTIADNVFSGIYGSNLTVINSTLTGNTGGGITSFGNSYVASSTISGNTDTELPEFSLIYSLNAFAGGITSGSGQVTLYNTIVAGNTGPTTNGLNGDTNSNEVNGSFISLGHNLIGQADNQSSSGFISTDQVGTTANPIDPKLGPLQDNGGPTPTMALLTGSPAVAAGSSENAPATDQRGDPRPQQSAIDIGAFEVTAPSTNPISLLPASLPDATAGMSYNQSITAGGGVGTLTLSTDPASVSLPAGLKLTISGSTLTISGKPTASGSASFSVTAADTSGDTATQNYTLTVNAAVPPSITSNPSGHTVTAGQSVSFTASASGSPTPTAQWQVSTDGGATFSNVSGFTSTTLTLSNVTTAMSGYEYRAVFTNSAGSKTTSAATLTVNPAQSPPPLPPPPASPPPAPVLNPPPLLAFFDSLFKGTETVNADGSASVTDAIFGIPLLVSTFDSSGHLVSVELFGFINITFLFLFL